MSESSATNLVLLDVFLSDYVLDLFKEVNEFDFLFYAL